MICSGVRKLGVFGLPFVVCKWKEAKRGLVGNGIVKCDSCGSGSEVAGKGRVIISWGAVEEGTSSGAETSIGVNCEWEKKNSGLVAFFNYGGSSGKVGIAMAYIAAGELASFCLQMQREDGIRIYEVCWGCGRGAGDGDVKRDNAEAGFSVGACGIVGGKL